MWFILSAVVSALTSIFLTRFVTLAAEDFTNMLKEPNALPDNAESGHERSLGEPQMTAINLFVTALFFGSFVQSHWLVLSFFTGLIGSAALLLFIGALALLVRGGQWAEYGIARFYRQNLNSMNFADRAYNAAKRRAR
jgi:hypothetical protein